MTDSSFDDVDEFDFLPSTTIVPISATGTLLTELAQVPAPLERIQKCIDGIPLFRGVPEAPRRRSDVCQAQAKLCALMNLLILSTEDPPQQAKFHKQAMALTRSAYQDLVEHRRKEGARGAERALDPIRESIFTEEES